MLIRSLKKYPLLFLCAIILMLGVNVPAAVANEGEISLKVSDNGGNPLADALVKLYIVEVEEPEGEDEEPIEFETLMEEGITNGEGTILFHGLEAGNYRARAVKDNLSNLPSIIDITEKEFAEASIQLQPYKEFELIGHILSIKDYRYNDQFPGPTFTVKKGDLVRIDFSIPEEDIAHTVYIDEFSIKLPGIPAGTFSIIEFIADQAGEFYYYCALPSHRTLGMEGKLIVEE